MPTDPDLTTTYRAYLSALNDRRFADLTRFVHDTLTYNDELLTRAQYASMIEADTRAVPDLHFVPQLLLADADAVACRLWFTCTPTSTFFGCAPTGRQIAFAEHVFYRFTDGRIAQVLSLIDRTAIAAQLSG
ncbi:Predicted ester cyclase [Pseudonocardia thermophila]|jgi:Predicted ester cyclase|uniref:Predicted ester cyclase n=1 Tax=Pseudonocardia thermophila TaxID=1848 RepID=A0A1M6SY25_PSETH|nr:ester cyclase [Pseudonocardia thermophila]SHK49547.1 Predicted ester cyclase [Pseudonocardia thermophila]